MNTSLCLKKYKIKKKYEGLYFPGLSCYVSDCLNLVKTRLMIIINVPSLFTGKWEVLFVDVFEDFLLVGKAHPTFEGGGRFWIADCGFGISDLPPGDVVCFGYGAVSKMGHGLIKINSLLI